MRRLSPAATMIAESTVEKLKGLQEYKIGAGPRKFPFKLCNSCNFFNRLVPFHFPPSVLCHQPDRPLSPATLSSLRPFALARLRLPQQSFHAQLSKFHRRSSAAANIRSKSTILLSPFPQVLRDRLF